MIAQTSVQPTIERTTFYSLPRFLSEIEHITTIDTGGLEFVICCDKMKLYIFPLVLGSNKPLGNIHQSLPIPNIKSLRTIAKNYLMIETQNKYIGIFEIIKSANKEPTQKTLSPFQVNAVKVEFSEVLKWRIFFCYFIREVMENLFEVQVFFNDMEFEIFQFTIKNKRGSMSFMISPNGKIQKCNKKQLYGSKCFFNIGRKLMYWLKSFSDKQFVIQELSIQPSLGPLGGNKLLNEPFAYFGVQRSEEYKQIYPNLMIRDCINPSKRFALKLQKQSFLNELKVQMAQLTPSKRKHTGQQNPFNELVEQSSYMENINQILQNLKITTFTDMLMVQNKIRKEVEIYQIKGDGAELIGKESSHILPSNELKDKKVEGPQSPHFDFKRWEWHFGNSKKLIGIDKLGLQLKYIQEICPEVKQQKIIEVQVVNMNEKIQEPKEASQTTPNQTLVASQENLPEKVQGSPKSSGEQRQILQEAESEPKRKFSKDQLEKFCNDFKDQDAKKYVDKELIKKVQEVNSWIKKQVIQNQNSKIANFKFKTHNESLMAKKQPQEPKVPQTKYEPSSQKQEKTEVEPIKPHVQMKPQSKSLTPTQQTLPPELKRPMKIIQRNKISVAKNFQNPTQGKANDEVKTDETKKETQKPKEQVQKQKTPKKEPSKSQNQQSPFTKFRLKDETVQQKIPEETDKKRFMKDHLSNQRKEENHQNLSKIHESTQPQKKEEKVKFNVITRASLLKKKQAETSESKGNQEKKEPEKSIKTENLDEPKKNQTYQPNETVETNKISEPKIQNSKPKKEQEVQEVPENAVKQQEGEPRTKFIPSIDIGKVSKNQLNDCDFLSEDSVSNEDKSMREVENSYLPNEENQNDDNESIEEEIDGDQNDDNSSKKETDKEYLIDDDINVVRPVQTQSKAQKEEKAPALNQDEQIEKFCYTLLDDESAPKYNHKQPQSAKSEVKVQRKSDELPSLVNTPSFKMENVGQFVTKNSQNGSTAQQKQEEDEMKKLSSLLFKTSIKRTNIFSNEVDQPQDKAKIFVNLSESREKPSKIVEAEKIQSKQVNSQIKDSKQEQNTSEQKQATELNQVSKKSRDWHETSSDQDSQESEPKDMEEQKNQKNDLKLQEMAEKSKGFQDPKNKILLENSLKDAVKLAQHSIQEPSEKVESKPQNKSFETQPEAIQAVDASKIEPELKNPTLTNIQPKESKTQSLSQAETASQETQNKSQKDQKPIPPVNVFSKPSIKIPNMFFNPNPSNPFTHFQKNPQSNLSLPNIFQSPPSNVIGGSNTNMYKKLLPERQNKKNQQTKKQEEPKQLQNLSSQTPKKQGKTQENSLSKVAVQSEQPKLVEKKVIHTSALPEIQQLISKYEHSTIKLLQEQQKTIIKSLEEIPHTHNPYNKNNSLLLPEEIKEEIIKQSKQSVKKWLSTKMLDKIETSFREIMQEHKSVYEEALKFYETEARKKITTMQLQYEQQSSILMDIENVSANMCAALQSSILEGEELHSYQLKEWKKEIEQAESTLIDPLVSKVDDTKIYFDSRNKNLESMTGELKEIKEILKQKLRKKQELKELKERKKLEKQQKIRQKIEEQTKLQMLRAKEETKKQSKKRKQNESHVNFNGQTPQYRQNESQYYQRPPYGFY